MTEFQVGDRVRYKRVPDPERVRKVLGVYPGQLWLERPAEGGGMPGGTHVGIAEDWELVPKFSPGDLVAYPPPWSRMMRVVWAAPDRNGRILCEYVGDGIDGTYCLPLEGELTPKEDPK